MCTTEINRLLAAHMAIVDTGSLLYSLQQMYRFTLVVLLRFVRKRSLLFDSRCKS